MAGLPGLPPPGFASKGKGLPGLPPPGFASASGPSPQELIGEGSNLQKFGRAAVGGLTQLIPFGEELVAGGSSAIDDLGALIRGEEINPESYNQRLAEIEGYQSAMNQTYKKAGPVVETFQNVGPALLMPFKSKVPARASILGKTAQAAGEGAAVGGVFGASEGATLAERLQNALAGAESGAKWGAGIVAPIAVAGKVLGGASKAANNYATSRAEDLFGVTGKTIEKSVKRGVQFVDEAGNPVAAEDAVDFTSRLSRRIENLRQGAFWKTLSNNPKDNFIKVSAELDDLNKAKNAIVQEVDQGLATFQQQTGSRVKLKPDWSFAEKYIKSGKGTAGRKPALQNELDAIKADWAAKGGTFDDLVNFKGEVDTGKVFGVGPTDAASVKLREQVLLGIKNAAENAADAVTGKKGLFGETNSAIADLLSIKDLLATKGAGASGGLRRVVEGAKSFRNLAVGAAGGLVGGPGAAGAAVAGSVLGKAFPKTASSIGRGVGETLRAGAQVGSRATALGAKIGGGVASPGTSPLQRSEREQQSQRTLNTTSPNSPRSIYGKQGSIYEVKPSRSIYGGSMDAPELKNLSAPVEQASPISDDLLDAVRMVESSGGKRVIGPETKYGRAKGPYQLLDDTGREWHAKLGIKEKYDPFDEKQSRKIAKAYLDYLYDEFGSVQLALTAYHTGMGNVRAGKVGKLGREYAPKVLGLLKA